MRRCVVVILAAAGLIGACGGASVSDDVIALEADRLCDLPRFAYVQASDIDAELTSALDAAGISRATYDTFKAHLDDDRDLRSRVAETFSEVCGEG